MTALLTPNRATGTLYRRGLDLTQRGVLPTPPRVERPAPREFRDWRLPLAAPHTERTN